MDIGVSGIEPGQRRLNGPQTTGRDYRNLSQPTFAMTEDDDISVPMRDGISLLADVHRPAEPGRYPVLVAASPYPRQIQNLGAPAGFIEAGASDFFVPQVAHSKNGVTSTPTNPGVYSGQWIIGVPTGLSDSTVRAVGRSDVGGQECGVFRGVLRA